MANRQEKERYMQQNYQGYLNTLKDAGLSSEAMSYSKFQQRYPWESLGNWVSDTQLLINKKQSESEQAKSKTEQDTALQSYQSQINALKSQLETAKSEMPQYSYEQSPEIQKVTEELNARLAGGRPEFTPESASQWSDYLNKIYSPFEKNAVEKLREEFSFNDPYSYGSGTQMSATSDLLQDMAAEKATQSLGLAQSDYQNKLNEYNQAIPGLTGLGQYGESMKKSASDTALNNYWNMLNTQMNLGQTGLQGSQDISNLYTQRGWNLADSATKRQNELQDWYANAILAKEIANMYQPKETPWYSDLLSGASQMLGGYLTGGAIKGLSGLFGGGGGSSSLGSSRLSLYPSNSILSWGG